MSPSDWPFEQEQIPLSDWDELQRALVEGKPNRELELPYSFLMEACSGLQKTVSWLSAANSLNEQGMQSWAYVSAYEAGLTATITLALLFGCVPLRAKANNRWLLIDIAPAINYRGKEGSGKDWSITDGISISQKEWWALTRVICHKIEEWPEDAKSYVNLLKKCDHTKMAYTRNELQYEMLCELRREELLTPFTALISKSSVLADHISCIQKQKEGWGGRGDGLVLEQLNAVRGILKALVSAIVENRNSPFANKLVSLGQEL